MTLGLLLAVALSASAQSDWPDGVPPIPAGVVVEPELHCRPEVIEAMNKIWDIVGRGREDYEAAFRIDRSEAGEYSVKLATMTFEDMRMTLLIDRARTVAVVHTHPDSSVHHPADKDFDVPVPTYVVSSRGLTVTVPGTKRWKSVRRRWNRPCG